MTAEEALDGGAPPADGEGAPAHTPRGKVSSKSQMRGSALLLVGRLLGMGLGLVIQLLLVRVLSKDDYGAFAWALSIVTLVQSVIPLGLDRIDSRFLAKYDEEGDDRKVVGVLVTETLVVVGLSTVIFLGVLLWHGRLSPGIAPSETAANLLVLMVLLAPLAAIDAMVMNTFATFARARAVFYRRYLLEPGLRLTAILVVFLLGAGVYGLTIGYVLASLLGVSIYVVMVVRLLSRLGFLANLHGRVTLPVRALLREGFPLMTSSLVYVVVMAVPTFVLGAVGTAADVASLRAVLPIAQLSMAASGAFWVLFPPMITRQWERGDMRGVRLTYWRTALWVALVSYPALVISVSFAEPTTVTLLGRQYADSAPLLAILGFGFWFQSATGFSAIMMATAGRLRFVFFANVTILVLGTALSLLLIPPYGAWGAAVGMTLSLVLGNILRQLGLAGLPPGVAERWMAGPFAAMGAGVVLTVLLQFWIGAGFVLALILTGVVSLAVLVVTLPYLDVAHTFPELLKIPVAGPLLRRWSSRGSAATRNPYRGASEGAGDVASTTAGARVDPRVDDPLFLLPDPGDGVRHGPLAPAEVADRLRDLPAGTWVVIALAPSRRSLRSTFSALAAAGLQDIALHWEAPRRSARTMLVPLDSRPVVLAALARHEGSRRGRLLSRAGSLLVSIGLVSLVARDRLATGRTAPAAGSER
ncbi:MAG: oligosaccharide flippase family protein [Candidatus Nanopelagicales bacterium]